MFKSKAHIGVDIGSHTIKVCQLKRIGDTYELERFGLAEIYPEGDRPEDPAAQQAAKIEALKRALADGGIKARLSVSSVCGEAIIVRYLQLPEMPQDELKKALQWEAEEYIPFRLAEVNLDSQILGRVMDGDHPKMDVLLVSAKKDLIESHVAVLRGAGLEPRIVDVDSFAFVNCFELNHGLNPEECVALVNIGGEITSINIVCGGASRFARDIPIGGDTITLAVRSRLNGSFREAELFKISQGVPAAAPEAPEASSFTGSLISSIRGRVEEMALGEGGGAPAPETLAVRAMQSVLGNLYSEVRRSIEFFENQYRGLNVSRVILGGGTAMLRNLPETFQQELRVPVELINPLHRLNVTVKTTPAEQIQAIRYQLGVSIGLGLRGLAA